MRRAAGGRRGRLRRRQLGKDAAAAEEVRRRSWKRNEIRGMEEGMEEEKLQGHELQELERDEAS